MGVVEMGYALSMVNNWHTRLARRIGDAASSTAVGFGAFLLLATWLAVGLVQGFSRTWFEILFAVTGAVTFLMVFFIQHATNRDIRAALLKLDQLVEATGGADDRVIGAEREDLKDQKKLEERLRSF